MKRQDILSTAGDLIDGDRDRIYGSARDNFTVIAKLWEPIVKVSISPAQVAMMMNQVKIARLLNTPDHPDSWVDAAGYIALGGEIATETASKGELGEPTTSQPSVPTCTAVNGIPFTEDHAYYHALDRLKHGLTTSLADLTPEGVARFEEYKNALVRAAVDAHVIELAPASSATPDTEVDAERPAAVS